MKKCAILLVLGMLLGGCAAQPVFETLGAVPVQGETAAKQQMLVELPGDLVSPVMETGELGKLYLCDDYSMSLQTLPGGDLDRTLRSCTGFSAGELTVMCVGTDQVKRYEMAWTAAGEKGTQTCRGVVLDDGNYHYVLTVMAPSDKAGKLAAKWQRLFDTFRLESQPTPVNIGS